MASASVNPLGQSSLAKRLGWTFLLLCCYRIGVHVPIPGVDAAALAAYFKSLSGTLFDMFDMFSGGGLSNVSVFALGVMPYISASIIMQLLQVVSPDIKRMAKEEGQAGRRKITQYTRYLTVLITLVQGLFISIGLESMTSPDGTPIVLNAGWHFRMVTMATFTAGSMLVMWLGEQITERGIGNGISLIIFCGIVVGIPRGIMQSMDLIKSGSMSIFLAVIIVLLMAAVLTAIVFVERAQRRIPISYAKRQIGRKMFGGVNTAGVIPPIFASSLLLFPATVGQFSTNEYVRMVTDFFAPHGVLYNVLYVVLIFFFCYFYTAIIIDPKDMAENLKKNGGFVPGIHRHRTLASDPERRGVHLGHFPAAHAHDRQVQRAVLLRWYQPADPCRRGHGLHESGRVPHDLNPVPGVDEQGGPQGRPHVILAKRAGKS